MTTEQIIKWLESPEGEAWSRAFHQGPAYGWGEIATIVPLSMNSNAASSKYIMAELVPPVNCASL